MKKLISIVMSLAVLGSVTTMTANAVTPNTITSPDTQGGSNVLMNGATIPTPTYTVTIPEKVDFGTVTKVVKGTPDSTAIVKTANYSVSAEYQHLYENQKSLSVTMTTDNKIVSGENSIKFNLFNDDDTALETDTTIVDVTPTNVEGSLDKDLKLQTSKNFYATLDQRLIKASGDYTGTVTFTVAMTDVE